MSFPKDFVWGAASSSYQIEGSAARAGGGLSIWDIFCRQEGNVWNNQSGEIGCDHYNRFREDVAIMRSIGLKAYRLSLSWPRVLPDGTGRVNFAGVDFYDKLIDELLGAGITPYVTLYHWDLPYELHRRGGWMNREIAHWFAEYTTLMVNRLSDRVTHWMTWNEPQCFVGLGYGSGNHAPGFKLDAYERAHIAHNVHLAHGRSVQAIRAATRRPAQVGFASFGMVFLPATETPEDIEAARYMMFDNPEKSEWNNSWWLDPPLLGKYPEPLWKAREKDGDLPDIQPGDMEIIHQPLDFFGVNIYSGTPARARVGEKPETMCEKGKALLTAFKWPVTPSALYWGPKLYHDRYKLPVYITENGMSSADIVSLDGKVHDPQRIDFMNRYLLEYRRAAEAGIDVKGYFAWSILDNFEWAEGFKERFGMVFVDYPTQKRIVKDSANWYHSIIESNGEILGL